LLVVAGRREEGFARKKSFDFGIKGLTGIEGHVRTFRIYVGAVSESPPRTAEDTKFEPLNIQF
jgi:hypothetical protein